MARLDIAKARQAGLSDAQIQMYAQNRGVSLYDSSPRQPAAQAQGQGGGLSDWLPTIGAIGGSFLPIPGGPVIGSALGAGGATLAKQLFQQKPVDVGEIGKEAALGGAGGLLGLGVGRLFPRLAAQAAPAAAQATESLIPRAVKGAGQALRQSVLKPQVPISATTATERGALLEGAKNIGLKGGPRAMQGQSAQRYTEIIGDIDKRLAINNPTVDPNVAIARARDAVTKSLNFDPGKKEWLRLGNVQAKNIGNIRDVKGLLAHKLTLGRELTPAFKKLEIGSPLTPAEEVKHAVWEAIDDIIAEAAPDITQQTRSLSLLHKLAPGLEKSAEAGVQLPFGARLPGILGETVQGIEAGVGRGLERVGTGSIPRPTGGFPFGQLAAQGAGQGTARSLSGGAPVQEGEIIDPSPETYPALPQQEDQTAGVRQAIGMALLQRAKSASDVKTAFEFLSGGGEKPLPIEAQKQKNLAKSGLRGLQEVAQIVQEDPNIFNKQLVPGKFFSRKFDSALFRTVEALLRARSGAAVPETEVRRYMQSFAPRFGDDPQTIQFKLEQLQQDLQDMASGASTAIPDTSFAFPLPQGVGL